jgi:hypothetical protein
VKQDCLKLFVNPVRKSDEGHRENWFDGPGYVYGTGCTKAKIQVDILIFPIYFFIIDAHYLTGTD